MAVDGLVVEGIKLLVLAIGEQIRLAWGFNEELRQLRLSVEGIQFYLDDAEQKQLVDRFVKRWLQELGEIGLEAENLLDEIRYEGLRRKIEIRDQLQKKITEASQLGLQQRLGSQPTFSIEETSSLNVETVGREADVSKLVDLVITASASPQSLPVISIVGMAGLGKTALAKRVINHKQVQRHFDEHLWVCVSERFHVQTILRKMLESLKACLFKSKGAMVRELRERLREKRCLLVLDDTWNTNDMEWNELKVCLLGVTKNSESVILATTRSQEVALTMRSPIDLTHQPTKLSTEECWSIIKSSVFSNTSAICLDLENIGINIAEKCKGVPLLAKVIGATMGKDTTKEARSSIQQSPLWDSLGSNNDFLDKVHFGIVMETLKLAKCMIQSIGLHDLF